LAHDLGLIVCVGKKNPPPALLMVVVYLKGKAYFYVDVAGKGTAKNSNDGLMVVWLPMEVRL
jgi:hypothetical protein